MKGGGALRDETKTVSRETREEKRVTRVCKQVACEQQTHFRSSLLSLRKIAIFRRERGDDRKCVCGSQATKQAGYQGKRKGLGG